MADLVLPLKGDSTKFVIGAAIAAVGLATAEGFSSVDKAEPEGTHEATPEAGDDSVESWTTTLNSEPQQEQEHDVEVTIVPETEETHPDVDSSLRDSPTPVPLPHEPESSQIETELVAESQVETTSAATTRSVPIDVDASLSETSPNAHEDIEEVQTQVDDASIIKDEPIPGSNVAVVGEETEGQIEIESTPATQAVVGPSSVTDVAPTTSEAITEVGETVSVLEQVSFRSLFFFDRNFFLMTICFKCRNSRHLSWFLLSLKLPPSPSLKLRKKPQLNIHRQQKRLPSYPH